LPHSVHESHHYFDGLQQQNTFSPFLQIYFYNSNSAVNTSMGLCVHDKDAAADDGDNDVNTCVLQRRRIYHLASLPTQQS